MLFTSGSTGHPKGVRVSHTNVTSLLDAVGELLEISADDRCSQTFDLTFDLSAFDMFVCWTAGASLHVVPHSLALRPDRVIIERELAVWFSVPATPCCCVR